MARPQSAIFAHPFYSKLFKTAQEISSAFFAGCYCLHFIVHAWTSPGLNLGGISKVDLRASTPDLHNGSVRSAPLCTVDFLLILDLFHSLNFFWTETLKFTAISRTVSFV